jgi:hypothetical protein
LCQAKKTLYVPGFLITFEHKVVREYGPKDSL